MRLLRRKDDGNYSLAEFFGNDIPRYAILSHTWGADDTEVTFRDLSEGKGHTKDGYRKVQFCGDQAAKDGLNYFWVDTCCIDKTSSAELAEAINSMFAWYREADKCYVYLSDVSTSCGKFESNNLALRQSRWFTRGWTLQELVAPTSVEFFSVEGQRLGDKSSMIDELHQITQISVKALQEGSRRSLDEIGIEERMSWIAQRQTKRREDAAYSLLGIFGVHMPLIYGEGRENAFARLETEIDHRLPRRSRGRKHNKFKNQPFSTVPFAPDPDFVDRPELLSWMRDKLARPGARAALVGIGGIGKSQLAIQYAHWVRNVAPHKFVFWVYVGTRARFEQAYQDIAERLRLPGRNDIKLDVLKLVSDWLCDETNSEWTMVLDNADFADTFFLGHSEKRNDNDIMPLSTYLPQSRNGSILITSRNKDVAARLTGGYNHTREVYAMNEGESLQLLHNKLRNTEGEDGTIELLGALSHMPLAISQAAAYINRRAHMTAAGYLKELSANNRKREHLLNWNVGDLRRDESASNSILSIFQLSYERIRQERPSAADLLSLMSFFNPQSIPESVLRQYTKRDINGDDQSEADDKFEADVDLLQAYSLIAATTGTDAYEIHALAQVCMQSWLSSLGDAERWQHKFVHLMSYEFPEATYENWPQCRQLLPHIEQLLEDEPMVEAVLEPWARLLTNVSWYLRSQGSYDSAQKTVVKALAAQECVLRGDHEMMLKSMNELALVLQALGKYSEAEELLQRILTIRRRDLGPEHDATLMTMGSLAGVYYDQGKFGQAETIHRRTLEVRERVLGEQHPDTLRDGSQLAVTLQAQGHYTEAEGFHRKALEWRKVKLGEVHPETLTSLHCLGMVLQAQNKSDEAEYLYRKAMEGKKKELGEQHPSTVTSMSNLVSVLLDLKKYNEAEPLIRHVLQKRKEIGEAEHPNTLTSLSILARVLSEQGGYEEAEKLSRQALEGRMKQLGEQHPDTLTSMNNLAHLLSELGRFEEAAEYFRKAIDGLEQSLGPQHPWTTACRNNSWAMDQHVAQ